MEKKKGRHCSQLDIQLLKNSTKRQIFGRDQIKAFADDKINVAQMMISDSDRVKNIVGKGENAGYQHFLLFPQCFQKDFSWIFLYKSRDCVVKS